MKSFKFGWLVPALIVAVNAIAVLVSWKSLAETLPAHFDLQGNASGSIPRNMLIVYLAVSAAICLVSYALSRLTKKKLVKCGFAILATGLALVIFSSTMVTLTTGKKPFFMLAEPVILVLSLVGMVICLVKARKTA